MAKSIMDQINDLTSGKTKPKTKRQQDRESATAKDMRKRIKNLVEGTTATVDPALQSKATAAQALVMEIEPQIRSVSITDNETYLVFEKHYLRIRAARAEWKEDIEKIIRPQRDALEAVYELNRKTDRPREDLEKLIKTMMEGYQYQLQAKAREEQRIKDEQAQQLRNEATRLAEQARIAPTPQMAKKLIQRSTQKMETAEAVEELDIESKVDSADTHIRKKMQWEVTDTMALIKAVASGDIPMDVLEVSSVSMNKYFKTSQADMAEWPGVRVYEALGLAKGSRWQEGQ